MFISFEGIDGSGKSTAMEKLKKYIKSKYDLNDFIFTREPGGYNLPECEQIRNIILDKNNKDLIPVSEMLLYLASRKIHVEKLIKPSIQKNKIVISDRFLDSSIAYQGGGRELGLEFVENLNLDVLKNFKPNFTFYFKIDYKTSLERMNKNKIELDRLENESKDFYKKVIESYNYLSQRDKERYIIIDATKSSDEVFEELIKEFEKIMRSINGN